MTHQIPIVRTVAALRETVNAWKREGLRVGLVPTMGALHHGHLSLVHAIGEKADRVIVSIFVNPTQFGVGEDFEKYPRTEVEDCRKLETTPASLVFAPNAAEMYPKGFASSVSVSGISDRFEGALRPGHFDGVATVVSKLLLQSMADVAIFGEKDYQQLAVIRRFVADLNIPVEIMGGTLIREDDGLAASSRNVYLNAEERVIAGQFNVILRQLVRDVEGGANLRVAEDTAKQALMDAGFLSVDYVSVVDCETLEPLAHLNGEARVIAVARLGGVRLLDNMAIGSV
ncbi:pantoate--beta-alanine ligase [Kordiimonas gwangyangensis]|uniref:pantoate--beta-alanine ligase n=1 Tax=Kordiimonas gwangyangensis TaxID=288022 RepID=UPI000366FFC6|nr:pantoate--beta-alanine ligase [Kordiimonas gwangyangensis]